MILVDSCLIVIGIGRHTMFHFKEIISITIHIGFRCCCQTDHDSIKILKDGSVFFEDTSMAFINNDQIKMSRSKQADSIFALRIINGI